VSDQTAEDLQLAHALERDGRSMLCYLHNITLHSSLEERRPVCHNPRQ
jgi:hypothetical protein